MVNSFLVLLCSCAGLLLSLFNWLFFHPQVFSLLPFHPHPITGAGGAAARCSSPGLNQDKQIVRRKALCHPLGLDGGYQPNHRHSKARMGMLSRHAQLQEFYYFSAFVRVLMLVVPQRSRGKTLQVGAEQT